MVTQSSLTNSFVDERDVSPLTLKTTLVHLLND